MDNKIIREISSNELLYLDMQDICNSFAIQYVFEIKSDYNISLMQEALNNVQKNNIGSSVCFSNKKWYEQKQEIEIKTINIKDKDFYDSNFLREKIDYNKESIQVWIVKNNNKFYLVFKFLHSVSDGKGALIFVSNFFNFLNNKELLSCNNYITDKEFISNLNYNKDKANLLPRFINKNSSKIKKYNPKWSIIELDGYHQAIVSKMAYILAKEFENKEVTFMIPTDIRRHNKETNYIGNLTLPIFLDVKDDDDYQSINVKLLYDLKNKKELNMTNANHFFYMPLPKFIRNGLLKTSAKVIDMTNKFCTGGIISHLGRVNLDDFNSASLTINDFVSVPIVQPTTAFSIVIIEYSNKTNIAIGHYENQFSEKYINDLCKKIYNGIVDNIYGFNSTDKNLNTNLLDQLKDTICNNPNEAAIYEGNKKYIYSELKININKYIEYYKKLKINQGDKVLLYMSRSFEYISALLACAFKGIIFIPVDISTINERVNKIIDISNPSLIIYDEKIEIKSDYKKVSPNEIPKSNSKSDFKYEYNDKNILYQIYTSGTTGIPKCVEISNKNFSNYILWAKDTYKTKRKIVMPLFTSISVDLTMTSTFLPLITDGSIKVYKEKFNPNILKKVLKDPTVNVIKCTPTHLTFLLSKNYEIVNKEIYIVGGENFTNDLANKVQTMSGTETKIYNEYGPAETTVGSSYFCYDNSSTSATASIGKPIYNTKIILFNDKVIEKTKETGEILISGDGVFAGYNGINNNPFKLINNTKYYCTGDLGYVEDDNLYCLGRKDTQVKINGNRVELEEISSQINNISGINDSYIVFHNNNLYSFIIKKKDTVNDTDISNHLMKVLPKYMIPKQFIFVDSFPVLPSGKVDKDKLITIIPNNESNNIEDENDKILSILKKIDNTLSYDKQKNLFDIGIESFEMIMFFQELANHFISEEKEEEFISCLINDIDDLNINKIEKVIVKSGGKL
ncbi:MAG: AMP-binding protein [Bacilli bacterium]|nr:AMP-binding protein [Bacilli bacterium]